MKHRLNILFLTLFVLSLPAAARQDSIKNRLVLNDGSVYTGQMRLRKPYGTGRTDHANGDVYEGAYEKGYRKGVGLRLPADALSKLAPAYSPQGAMWLPSASPPLPCRRAFTCGPTAHTTPVNGRETNVREQA